MTSQEVWRSQQSPVGHRAYERRRARPLSPTHYMEPTAGTHTRPGHTPSVTRSVHKSNSTPWRCHYSPAQVPPPYRTQSDKPPPRCCYISHKGLFLPLATSFQSWSTCLRTPCGCPRMETHGLGQRIGPPTEKRWLTLNTATAQTPGRRQTHLGKTGVIIPRL